MKSDARSRLQQGRRAAQYAARLLLLVPWFVFGQTLAEEQLEQEPIVIKGNQGLPGTIFIAPWKRTDSPLPNEKLKGNIGEDTEPLERDLFQRELELQQEGYSIEPSPTPQVLQDSAVDN